MSLNLTMSSGKRADGQERQKDDYYATHPQAVKDFLIALDRDNVSIRKYIWECACGEGHMAKVFKDFGYEVFATDLVNRGYGNCFMDFLSEYNSSAETFLQYCDIFTNPPFKYAEDFAYRGIRILRKGHLLGLFVKIQFLESKSRKKLFEEYPPKYVYVYSERQQCSMNGDFENLKAKTQCYCWVIWEKDYKGETVLRWI